MGMTQSDNLGRNPGIAATSNILGPVEQQPT